MPMGIDTQIPMGIILSIGPTHGAQRKERAVMQVETKVDVLAQRWPIGTVFTRRGREPRECTGVDVLRTYNAAGELVRLRYVATHKFLGQTLRDEDVVDASVAMGEPRLPEATLARVSGGGK